MKNKILKTLLAISITTNIFGAISYNEKSDLIEHNNAKISHLQDNVETKSTKIAKLEGAIILKNERIKKQQKVIDNSYKSINELEAKAKKLQAERDKALAEKIRANFNKSEKGSDVEGRKITVEASAYIAMCSEGCTGRTATGVNVSNTIYYKGFRVIAVDTSVIPLNSLVRVETSSGTFTAMAIDTGGYIRGNRIDILVSSRSEAMRFGRKQATLTILREGD